MTGGADAVCKNCAQPVHWRTNPLGSGWSLLGEQRFTCRTGASRRSPHMVLPPPVESPTLLEEWLST